LQPVDAEEIRLRGAELTRKLPVPGPHFWGRMPPTAIGPAPPRATAN